MSKFLNSAFILCLILGVVSLYSQDSIVSDSEITPFRKGRWLTGISGSINSSRNEAGINSEITTSNEYVLNINGGSFFKDRWLVGGIIQAGRSDTDSGTEITTETIFIGPQIAHYFSDSPRGSLFLGLAPGYTRYRNVVGFIDEGEIFEEVSEGSGFAILINLGYSYVVFDRIAFNIGLGLGRFWIDVDREREQETAIISDNLTIQNVSLNFGFSVLLDRLLQ